MAGNKDVKDKPAKTPTRSKTSKAATAPASPKASPFEPPTSSPMQAISDSLRAAAGLPDSAEIQRQRETNATDRRLLEQERTYLANQKRQQDERATALDEERQGIDDLLEELARDRGTLEAEQQALASRIGEQEQAEADLANRDRAISAREMQAEAGFAAHNRDALKPLHEEHERLRSEIAAATAALAAVKLDRSSALDEEIQAKRGERLNGLNEALDKRRAQAEQQQDKDLAAIRKRFDTDLARERRSFDNELTRQREVFDSELERQRELFGAEIERQRTEFDGRLAHERAELDDAKNALSAERSQWQEKTAAEEQRLHDREQALRIRAREVDNHAAEVDSDRSCLERQVEQRAAEKVQALQLKLDQRERRVDVLENERSRLEERYDSLQHALQRWGDLDPQEVHRRMQDLQAENDHLTQELNRRPGVEVQERLEQLEAERSNWDSRRRAMAHEIAGLNAQKSDWDLTVATLQEMRDQRDIAERRRDVLIAQVEKYQHDVNRLRSLHEQPREREARIEAIEEPVFDEIRRSLPDPDRTELAWLDTILDCCRDSGIVFSRRLLHAFHTSLKVADWSPLTLLAGVSGTGKSELPRLYARFGGLLFQPLSVEPNWDSPQSIFGFFNSVDNRFNATELLRAMVQSQHDADDSDYSAGTSDLLLLVLLDEMNLSHVELYFSELLSKLELRRGERESVDLPIDIGAGLPRYRVPLGRNVLWTGTMNEDETTKTLSDKVLDRGSLLHFPRPTEFKRRQKLKLGESQPLLPLETWETWRRDESTFDDSSVERFKTPLEEINRHLEGVGRALGHRVWQSVEIYMSNHPQVIDAAERAVGDKLDRALRMAYEDAIVQKVMPKLRGIETTGRASRSCLDPIEEILASNDLGLNLKEDFGLARKVGHGAFLWSSAHYLEAGE